MRIAFLDRARGALWGLAIGDAFGRSLEFLKGEAVRGRVVAIPSRDFMWTDDTHMSLYLIDALTGLGADFVFDGDRLGRAIADQFVRWADDPLTPSTAPGNTCLQGVAAYRRGIPWPEAGVRGSDGCGAVMRLVPLPIRFSGAELDEAARISALVTHAHPNAPAATVAGCRILRALLEGAPLNGETVRAVAAGLSHVEGMTPTVLGALEAAVTQAERPELEWLDEAAIPDGDGGWRSPSALGLALVAALRYQAEPRLAIEKAARIDGDSDSVACLAGMFIGAARGLDALPAELRAALPQQDRLHRQFEALLALIPTPPRTGPRTSETDPIRVAWAHTTPSGGRIGLTFAPGKKVASAFGAPWDRDLGVDLDRLRTVAGVDLLVTLLEDWELVRLQIPTLVGEAGARGIPVLRLPIPDGSPPPVLAAVQATLRQVGAALAAGHSVVFHCRGGLGRAGTLTACALIACGLPPEEAIAAVRRVRPGAIENRIQEEFVRGFRVLD
jgi:ADP-ribosylglycohydrolase